MAPGNRQPTARTPLLKAALAGLGVVFFAVAVARSASWAYGAGALCLAASVIAGRRPKRMARTTQPPNADGPPSPH
ncbi:hypothetical protein ACIRPT_26075 [Streptomyces sp. NPDC101227]|uniref:hypothetical protein n=1 Tax=Streptomyces sp. NPDC101227 TaxID=3366136 RepID=UPI0038114C6D